MNKPIYSADRIVSAPASLKKIPWRPAPTVAGWYWINGAKSFPEDYVCVYISVNEGGAHIVHDKIPESELGGTPLANFLKCDDFVFAGPLPEPEDGHEYGAEDA